MLLATFAASAAGHGVLTLPAGRQGGNIQGGGNSGQNGWYQDHSKIPLGTAKNCDRDMMTVHRNCYNGAPWRAPGFAHIANACGGQTGPDGGGDDPFAPGDGTLLPKMPRTKWQAGTAVKVAWGISINHGGGYAYRLCPESEPQLEACFQRHHLQFVGDTSTVHYIDGKEIAIPALTTTKGTSPAGSQWRRNPIPLGCGTTTCDNGHYRGLFAPPCPGCSGDRRNFSVVDEVFVPASLASGNYTLSWRWDTEETPQIWNNCGDVTIVNGPSPAPSPAPSPTPAPVTYVCTAGACVEGSGGLAKEICEQVCDSEVVAV